jgi:membrane-associated phospholipid phosphatase
MRVVAVRAALVFAIAALWSAPARAQRVVQPWEHLDDTLAGIYTWPNVMFHVGAAALTPVLAQTADLPVQNYFQIHNPLGGNGVADTLYFVGWVAPLSVPAGVWFGGLLTDDPELASGGAAAVQAVVVQAVVVSTLKWITDRAGPYPGGNPQSKRGSSPLFRNSNDPTDFDFNPFKISEGLRWPSGHTSSMFSLVSALTAFYPDQVLIPAIGYPIAAAVGLGVIEGDYHWFSDVVAGALIGHIIGWVTGTQFRRAFDAQTDARARSAAAAPAVQLQLIPTGRGLTLAGTF